MAKVLSRLDILLHANTANYVREMKKATDQTKKELKSVADYGKLVGGQLGMAFATLGSAVSISHIVQTADRMQDLASKVRINTQSMEEYNAVLHDLRKISTDYWTAMDGITDLYASSKRALDSLGASQRQVLDFTRNITMAMSIGGGSAQAQEAALIQLGQAMNMGVLRGQEFNSVSAQAPVIIDLLTDSLKVSQGELRAMAAEGKITSQVMMDAVLGGYDKLQDTINKMPTTFAQGIQNIKSQYDFLVDDIMNQNSVMSQNLANAALWIAEHFRTLVSAGAMVGAVWLTSIASNSALVTSFVGLTGATLANTKASIANAFSTQNQITAYQVLELKILSLSTSLGFKIINTIQATTNAVAYARSLVGLATSFNTATASARLHTLALAGVATAKRGAMGVGILATRAITGLGGAFMSLGRIITAHPIITLTAVIGAVIARTEGLEGAIKSLGDAFNIAGALVMDFIGGVVDGLGMAWTATANYFDKLMGGADDATSFAQTAFGGFFANTEKGFVGVGQVIARTFDLGGATVVWFVNSADKNIKALATSVNNTFKKMGNFAITVFEKAIHNIIDDVNNTIKGFSAIWEFFGGGSIPLIAKKSFGRFEYATPEYGGAGNIADHNPHYLENAWLNKHKELTRASNQANQANLNLANSTASLGKASDKATNGMKQANKAIKDVKESADDASKALDDLAKNMTEQYLSWDKQWYYLDRHKNILLDTESVKLDYQINSINGDLHGLGQDVKDHMTDVAKTIDEIMAGAELFHQRIDIFKNISMLKSDGEYQSLKYDLYNDANFLSLATENVKQEALYYMAFLEESKAVKEMQDNIINNQRELATLFRADGIARELFIINQETQSTLEKYNYLLKDGHTEQYKTIEQQAKYFENEKSRLAITKHYHDLTQSLKNEEEKRLDTMSRQLDVLMAHAMIEGNIFDMKKAKQVISLGVGTIEQNTNPYDELNAKKDEQLSMLNKGLQYLLEEELLTEQERINIKNWGADERLKIEKAHQKAMQSLILKDGQDIFSSLASIAKDGLGEQSRVYRMMFAMQQGFAIAQAGIAVQQAISQGLTKGFPAGLADMAMAVSHGAKIVSAIKSVVMPVGQAHDGIMSVPKSGTWNLEKGERVLPKHTAQNLDNTLNRLQGRGETKVIINNYTSEKAEVQKNDNGDIMVTIGKMMKQVGRAEAQQVLREELGQNGLISRRLR